MLRECPFCYGRGELSLEYWHEDGMEPCTWCGGYGNIEIGKDDMNCLKCMGTGSYSENNVSRYCPTCKGYRFIKKGDSLKCLYCQGYGEVLDDNKIIPCEKCNGKQVIKLQQDERNNLLLQNKNLTGILPTELNLPIYRVFSEKRLIDTLSSRKNSLVKTRLWDDPFENHFLKTEFIIDGKPSNRLNSLLESYYGQCWTLNEIETDALWRIYSPDKNGFRIKSTLRNLFKAFFDVQHPNATKSFYLGKIKYQNEMKIKAAYSGVADMSDFFDWPRYIVSRLFIKRTEFTHENEVRLILAADHSKFDSEERGPWYDLSKDSYEFPISINHHFEEILADPRMDDADFISAVRKIRELGYRNPIRKSRLYHLPAMRMYLRMR